MNDPIKQREELLKKQEVNRLVQNRMYQIRGLTEKVLAVDIKSLYNSDIESQDATKLKRSIHALINASVELERQLKKLNIKG